jgi:hypothetical protein
LDIESDKAARILKSFCKDGFYQEEERPTSDGPKAKQKVLKKIPAEVRCDFPPSEHTYITRGHFHESDVQVALGSASVQLHSSAIQRLPRLPSMTVQGIRAKKPKLNVVTMSGN